MNVRIDFGMVHDASTAEVLKRRYHDWGCGELKDLEYAAKWLTSQNWIDETKLGVFGASFGGFAAINCITGLPKY